MSALGNLLTARQYYSMAMDGLIKAEAHAMAGRPLSRAEVEDVESYLRRAANAVRDALDGEANVIRGPFQPHLKKIGEVAMRSVEDVGRVFDATALRDAKPINGGEKPQTDGAA